MKSLLQFSACVCLLALVGCSSGPVLPSMVSVRGSLQGSKTLQIAKAGAMVRFIPAQLEAVEAEADLKDDGSFVLRSVGNKDGAVPGKYKVVIEPTGSLAQRAKSTAIPARYRTPEQTPLEVVVKNETNDVVLKVE